MEPNSFIWIALICLHTINCIKTEIIGSYIAMATNLLNYLTKFGKI